MKNTITFVFLNRAMMLLTLTLYLTVIYGLIAQIVLGFFQLLVGLWLLYFLKKLPKRSQYLIVVYWMISVIYIALLFLGDFIFWEEWLTIIGIPYGIALFFTYILEQLKTKKS